MHVHSILNGCVILLFMYIYLCSIYPVHCIHTYIVYIHTHKVVAIPVNSENTVIIYYMYSTLCVTHVYVAQNLYKVTPTISCILIGLKILGQHTIEGLILR